ncbi:MAG: CPXCG motif-containing cysteine-rich protein [Nevskia sp.]|nr:CPXCG motif-containing cysteine-rich protein [Nevskia sp.]
MIEAAEVSCPACWETIELSLDLSAGSQTYTEDCPVCCRPMTVRLHVAAGGEDYSVEVEAESD